MAAAKKAASKNGRTTAAGTGATKGAGARTTSGAPKGAGAGAGASAATAGAGAGAPTTEDEYSDDFADFIDPTTAAAGGGQAAGSSSGAGATEDGEKRGRGRPPGAKNKPKNPPSLEGVQGILLSIHLMLAGLTGVKELNLSDDEAKKLAQAVVRVAELYDFDASEKTVAWTNLAICVGGIYGTRAFAYSMRVRQEEEMKRPKVQPFPFAPGAQANG